MVAAALPKASVTLDLLRHEEFLRYSKEPSLLAKVVEEQARRGAEAIFIDEVQKVPALLDEVHRLIERLPIRFVLTGSSARKLRRGGANLLAGRAERLPMHPLTAAEMGEAFDLERTLPRLLLFDTGVINALAHRLDADVDPVKRGRLFEQWLVLECRRHIDYAQSETRLYFWRTNHGAEVDLLVERHGKLLAAVEAKSARRIGGSDVSGLRAFAAENPDVPRFVVTPDATPHRRDDDILVTHWADFRSRFRTWL